MPFRDRNIFLVGMPGSGKTTLSKSLAQELGRKFIDLDQVIEREQQMSINEIFAVFGEERFREIEAQCLRAHALGYQDLVMATGGGTPCYHQNMDFINSNGISVYLEVPEEVLTQRLLTGPPHRPLLAGKSEKELLAYLGELLSIRKPYYRRATLVFSGIDMKPAQLLEMLGTL